MQPGYLRSEGTTNTSGCESREGQGGRPLAMGMLSIFSAGSFNTGIFRSTFGSTGAARSGTEQTCCAGLEDTVKVRGWTLANFFHWNQLGGAWKSEEGDDAGGWASKAEPPSAKAKR